MPTREELVQERAEVFGTIEANQEKLRDENLSTEEQDAIFTESDNLFDRMHRLDKEIRFETRKEAAQERFDFDKEFSVQRRPSGGDLKYRRVGWSTPVDDEDETPSIQQIQDRDKLVMARYDHGHESLSNEEKIISATKYAGERLTLRFWAEGGDWNALSSAEMDALKRYQSDFKHSLEREDAGITVAGGTPANVTKIKDFFVPTETERGILYEMQFTGPLGGPGGGYGRWDNYQTGAERQVNVNINAKTLMAGYVDELADVGLLKPNYRLQTLQFDTIGGLLPWSIQADQDSIEDMERELRFNLGMAFGNRLNTDLTKDDATRAKIQGLTSMLVAGAANPAGTDAPPARVTRLKAGGVITSDEIIDIKYSIDAAYRGRSDQFALMVDDTLALQIEKMREGTGDAAGGANRGAYLYQRATADGPPMIHGVSVIRNNAFDSVPNPAAAGNQVYGCMGDFRFFRIGTVRGISVQVLRELYARQLQIGLLGHMRFGSFIPDRHAFRLIQNKSA